MISMKRVRRENDPPDHFLIRLTLGAFAFRLVIQRRARQLQQRALPPLAQIMLLAHHFLPRFASRPEQLMRGIGQKIPLHHQLPDF
jgi:hypothetical protein